MLRIDSISKKFSAGNYGVRDFNLECKGGVLGLLGPNGAGKTTLMQMIATITKPTSGNIQFQGVDIGKNPDYLRRKLGYLPQDFGVYDNLTAVEFLTYFASLKGVHSKSRIHEILELVNLHTVATRNVGSFSGGMKQRLGISQALINDPDLLIVDEPTAGLDPEERVRFRNLLSETGYGKMVLLSTHIVSDIESIATEIAIMKEGRLLALAEPEVLLQAAEGNVWQLAMSSHEFEEARTRLKIANSVRKADGVHVRIVSPYQPAPGALPVEPGLEDAFLFYMNFYPSSRSEVSI
jgi:ABC-2 type transport system ATP-binding protein